MRRTLTERQSSFVLTSPQTSVTSSSFIANLFLPRTQSSGQLITPEASPAAPAAEVSAPEEAGQLESASTLSGSGECDITSVQTLVVTSVHKLIEERFESYDELEQYYHQIKNVPKHFLAPFEAVHVTQATEEGVQMQDCEETTLASCKSNTSTSADSCVTAVVAGASSKRDKPHACLTLLESFVLKLGMVLRWACNVRKRDYECLGS